MRTLNFIVDKQIITKSPGCDFTGLVAGTRGYLRAHFSFSADWSSYRKVAVFTCDAGEYPSPIVGGMCDVPDEAAASDSFKVHVVGKHGDNFIKSGRTTVVQRRY